MGVFRNPSHPEKCQVIWFCHRAMGLPEAIWHNGVTFDPLYRSSAGAQECMGNLDCRMTQDREPGQCWTQVPTVGTATGRSRGQEGIHLTWTVDVL